MASPYSYAGGWQRFQNSGYYPRPQYIGHAPNPYYPPRYFGSSHHVPLDSFYPTPHNFRGGRPLLPNPPPLMPLPPPWVRHHHGGGHFAPRPLFQSPPGQYQSQLTYRYQNPHVSQPLGSVGVIDSKILTSQSSSPIILPLMPSVPYVSSSSSHFEVVKAFKFMEGHDLVGDLKDGEMLIRGSLAECDVSGSIGYLKSGSNLNVEVRKDVLYIMGRKVDMDESFHDVLAAGTHIKAIIKKISVDSEKKDISENEKGDKSNKSDVKYTALLAWFGEIPDVQEVIPSILESKHLKVIKGEEEVSSISKGDQSNGTESNKSLSSVLSYILGYVWWANKDQGIMRIYETKDWGSECSGILFKADTIHFEGQRVECEMLHFLIAHINKCDVQAREIESKVVHGIVIKWEAVYVECGQVPHTMLRNGPCNDIIGTSRNNLINTLNSESSPEETDDDGCGKNENNTSQNFPRRAFQNKATFSTTEMKSIRTSEKREDVKLDKNSRENDLCRMKDLRISCDKADTVVLQSADDFKHLFHDEYSGKHLTGQIVELFSSQVGVGIAQWKSMDYGWVNIIFRQSDMFVDLIPINERMELSAVCARRCNLYVLPLKDQECLGYKIKLAATCGWLGAKPLLIPTPGEQPKAKISLCHLQVDPDADKENGSGNGSVKQSSLMGYPLSISQSNGTRDNNIWTTATNGKYKTKQKLSLPKESFEGDSSFYEDDKQDDGYQTGELIEVHCNIGKLQSEDGEDYYFSRNQCYLFGISLCHVELWHVLVYGQKLLFNVDRNLKKIHKVMIGTKDLDAGKSSDIEHIKNWCKNNAVADCAKDILVQQLKKSAATL